MTVRLRRAYESPSSLRVFRPGERRLQGAIGSNIRKADQYIQPYQFGDPYSKRTGLWLKNLPPLEPTNEVEPIAAWIRTGAGLKRHKAGIGIPSGVARDKRERSLTFPGIAKAMAEQWGSDDI